MIQPLNSVKANNNMPIFDMPSNFIVYDNITAELLKFYANFPCKIEACVFAQIERGQVVATVNLWEYNLKKNDFVVIIPGTFIQIKEVSDDIKISFAGYSSSFLKSINFWKIMSPIMLHLFNKPIFALGNDMGGIYSEMLSLLTRTAMLKDSRMLTTTVVENIMEIFISSLSEALKLDMARATPVSSRDQSVMAEFLQLAFENYHNEHKISFYAHEIGLTLSHFCSVISKTSGMTPQEIIMTLIIMDAKTQLKGSCATVTNIAATLGFPTPTTFNRYFRTYTGMTPQEYRNSK